MEHIEMGRTVHSFTASYPHLEYKCNPLSFRFWADFTYICHIDENMKTVQIFCSHDTDTIPHPLCNIKKYEHFFICRHPGSLNEPKVINSLLLCLGPLAYLYIGERILYFRTKEPVLEYECVPVPYEDYAYCAFASCRNFVYMIKLGLCVAPEMTDVSDPYADYFSLVRQYDGSEYTERQKHLRSRGDDYDPLIEDLSVTQKEMMLRSGSTERLLYERTSHYVPFELDELVVYENCIQFSLPEYRWTKFRSPGAKKKRCYSQSGLVDEARKKIRKAMFFEESQTVRDLLLLHHEIDLLSSTCSAPICLFEEALRFQCGVDVLHVLLEHIGERHGKELQSGVFFYDQKIVRTWMLRTQKQPVVRFLLQIRGFEEFDAVATWLGPAVAQHYAQDQPKMEYTTIVCDLMLHNSVPEENILHLLEHNQHIRKLLARWPRTEQEYEKFVAPLNGGSMRHPLVTAMENSRHAVVKFFLDSGQEFHWDILVDWRNRRKETLLHVCALIGYPLVAKRCLQSRFPVSHLMLQESPLISAIKHRQDAVVKLLLDYRRYHPTLPTEIMGLSKATAAAIESLNTRIMRTVIRRAPQVELDLDPLVYLKTVESDQIASLALTRAINQTFIELKRTLACELFCTVILIQMGFYSNGPGTVDDLKKTRFFHIIESLPIELSMLLSSMVYSGTEGSCFFKQKEIEKELNRLFRKMWKKDL